MAHITHKLSDTYAKGVDTLFVNAYDWFKRLIILLPAAHFTFVLIYLYFYYEGFGRGLSIFAAPTDVWGVSLSDVAPAYVSFFLGAVIGSVQSNAFSSTSAHASAGSQQRRLIHRVVTIVIVLTAIITVLAFSVAFYVVQRDFQLFAYNLLYLPIGITLVIAESAVSGFPSPPPMRARLLLIGILAVMMIAISGLSDGEYDRKLSYSELKSELALCSKRKLLRKIGDVYLAASQNGMRVIVDEDCKPLASFPLLRRPLLYKGMSPADAVKRF